MIRAVLFDLDGTLLDRDESVKKFIVNQYERLSNFLGHIPREKYMTRFIELDRRGYVWKDKVYQQLVEEFDIVGIDWENLLQDYISEFKHHCVPFPNLHSMLEELKKNDFVLGMITNGFGQFQMDNIRALGIEKYFDAILVSETEGIKKPDTAIFERALKRLRVTAGESVFIGDHPENDVMASQYVGMKGIWKKDVQWDAFETDFVVDDLEELPTMIKNLGRLVRSKTS
ncbi:HAD family hydrolase [Psychrobacillus soli]|uniref:HAD family hydrolase n=1 Tax=Psychrobacillus soli TaxID=1543965 RepID=A0A544T0K5_9BACI|nr:HAD family hydrolase [Psychrobacillus soli]TQR10955.1 HAD family hydrolase [Psychrobacillus soli]